MAAAGHKPVERVLLTNDDGVGAPGLAVLAEIAAELSHEVWVVAPERDQSGTSHAVSLHDPTRAQKLGERRFAVRGTPSDCVVVALGHLMPAPPTLVLSGVNRGANLGIETLFSGTVGAAMTARFLGIPALALSQAYRDRNQVRWACAATLAPALIRRLLDCGWPADTVLNINFPDCDPAEAQPARTARQGQGGVQNIEVEARADPRGFDYFWLRFRHGRPGTDADSETEVLRSGAVAVTPLRFERTDEAARLRLAETLGR